MRVRSVEKTTQRYVVNSARTFLENRKNGAWITGVVSHSGLPRLEVLSVLQPLRTYGNPNRSKFLFDWLDSTTW